MYEKVLSFSKFNARHIHGTQVTKRDDTCINKPQLQDICEKNVERFNIIRNVILVMCIPSIVGILISVNKNFKLYFLKIRLLIHFTT